MKFLCRIIERIRQLEINNYTYHRFGYEATHLSWSLYKRLRYVHSLERLGLGDFADGNSETHKLTREYDDKHFVLKG